MKKIKHNIFWVVLLSTSFLFGQKETKNKNESFKVNKDVLVEIHTRHTDVNVETWNRNTVSVQGSWEIDGVSKEEADKYFDRWEFEAMGNKKKVVITSKSSKNDYSHYDVFDDMDFDFDFDFDSITYIGEMFHGDYFSELHSVLEIPPVPPVSPMPPISPIPPVPAPFVEPLKEIEFDFEAYQKDKEGYMKKFEERQKKWQKEFEEKLEPQLKAYEEEIKEWEKKMEPQMKAYEEKLKQWEKEMAPKMKEYEKKMESRMKEMEIEMESKYAQKMKEKKEKMSKYKIKKQLLIKVPTGAILKMDARYGKITLPDGIKTAH